MSCCSAEGRRHCGHKCGIFCKLEFHYSKLWFFHHDRAVFFYFNCLPRNQVNQVLYLVWRWLGLLYFFSWLFEEAFEVNNSLYFIFLTHWSFIIFVTYLLVSAISVSVELLRSIFDKSRREEAIVLPRPDSEYSPPAGCCGYSDNKLPWYLCIHWFFFVLGNMVAIFVTILFWTALYRGGSPSVGSIHVHLINGVYAFTDITTSAVPLNAYHLVYLMVYGCIYAVFSGIYFAASGKFIYPVLNYADHPGAAAGVLLGTVLVAIPLIYVIMFFLSHLSKCCCKCGSRYHKRNSEDILEGEETAYREYKE